MVVAKVAQQGGQQAERVAARRDVGMMEIFIGFIGVITGFYVLVSTA